LIGAAAAAALVVSSPATAAMVYSETASGDLSNNGLSPTAFNLALGSNLLEGWTGRIDGSIDRDYFTFTLAANQMLQSIIFVDGNTIGVSFLGVQSGNQVTVSPSAADATGLLGWYHYSKADQGTDILDNMGIPMAGSTGFMGPLGPGTYAFWLQEASPGSPVHYGFNFVVGEFISESPVPEPATWAMMLLGFGLTGMALRRRRRLAAA
jgi:hypothetical protein